MASETKNRNEQRDQDGRYAHGLKAVCMCGATKGAHLAEAPHSLEETNCAAFRLGGGK